MAAVIVSMTGAPAYAGEPGSAGWQVVSAAGDARYRLSDAAGTPWRKLSAGTVLSTQAQLETGDDGRVVLLRDGDRVAMSPNSRILLPGSGPEKKVTTIFQSFGVMLYKVRSRAKSMLVGGLPARRFEVRTPYLVSMVKGTTFSISVTSSGSAVNLIEGILQVSNRDNSVSTQILGGQIASVARDARSAISVIKVDGTGHQVHRAPAAVEARARTGAPAATPDRAPRPAAVADSARTLGNNSGKLVSSLAAATRREAAQTRPGNTGRKVVSVRNTGFPIASDTPGAAAIKGNGSAIGRDRPKAAGVRGNGLGKSPGGKAVGGLGLGGGSGTAAAATSPAGAPAASAGPSGGAPVAAVSTPVFSGSPLGAPAVGLGNSLGGVPPGQLVSSLAHERNAIKKGLKIKKIK